MGQQRVDERARVVAGRGMRDQPGGLVDDQQVVVLVQHGQRDALGDERGVHGGRLLPGDHVRRAQGLARLGRAAVEPDVPLADQRLHARARQVRQRPGQEPVEPVARLRWAAR